MEESEALSVDYHVSDVENLHRLEQFLVRELEVALIEWLIKHQL